MTADDFRALALALPGATENAQNQHPDFRVGKKIFATLGYPDADHAMVKLTPPQQVMLVAAEQSIFAPVKGAWGRAGATLLHLASSDTNTARSALQMAHANQKP